MRDVDRHRYERLKADREIVDRAAAYLRHHARQDQYAGILHRPEVAFGLATVLDEVSRQLGEVNGGIRAETVRACRQLLGLPAAAAAGGGGGGIHPTPLTSSPP